jgi:hypothetical protein
MKDLIQKISVISFLQLNKRIQIQRNSLQGNHDQFQENNMFQTLDLKGLFRSHIIIKLNENAYFLTCDHTVYIWAFGNKKIGQNLILIYFLTFIRSHKSFF